MYTDKTLKIGVFPGRDVSSNPVVGLLSTAMQDWGVSVEDWRPDGTNAHLDVLMLHWLENLWLPDSPLAPRQELRFRRAQVLERLKNAKNQGTAVIWVAHNAVPHQWVGAYDDWVEQSRPFFELIDAVVYFNEATRLLPTMGHVMSLPFTVVRHPRYLLEGISNSDCATVLNSPCTPRRAMFLDAARPSKQSEPAILACIEAGIQTIVVAPKGGALLMKNLSRHQDFHSLVDYHSAAIPSQSLPQWFGPETAVILNQENQTNSGVALYALSYGSTVIAPACSFALELFDQFGDEWIRIFDPPITPEILKELMQKPVPQRPPCLDFNEPPHVAAMILQFIEFGLKPKA